MLLVTTPGCAVFLGCVRKLFKKAKRGRNTCEGSFLVGRFGIPCRHAESDSRLADVRRDGNEVPFVRSEREPKCDRVNTKQGEGKKKRKKNSYIIPVFFNFVLGHFLNSIYLYPYIFIYIFIYSFYN